MASVSLLGSSRTLMALPLVLSMCLLGGCKNSDSPTRESDAGMQSETDGSTAETDGQVMTTTDGGNTTGGDGGSTGRMCGVTGGACDVIAQNCPSSTEGCYFGAMEAGGPQTTMCLGTNMLGGDGAACMFINDCLPGFTCAAEGAQGVCRRHCCMGASSDCPAGSGQRCLGLVGGENIGVCVPAAECNLVTSEGCGAGQGCYVSGADGSLGCFGAGSKTEGMTCGALNECDRGLGCVNRSGAGLACTRYCRVSMGETDCGVGRTCQMASGLVLPADTGICPPPA